MADIVDLAARRSRPWAEAESAVERAVQDVMMSIGGDGAADAAVHELARTLADSGFSAELVAHIAQMVINRMLELRDLGSPC